MRNVCRTSRCIVANRKYSELPQDTPFSLGWFQFVPVYFCCTYFWYEHYF